MDISFSCSDCGQQLTVDDCGAGLSVACPKCGRNLTIPAPPAAKVVSETEQKSAVLKVRQQIKGQDLFHVTLDGKIEGPFTLQELAELYFGGRVQSDTLYSKNNSEHWHPISDIPMLKYARAVPSRTPVASPVGRTDLAEPSAASSNKPTGSGRVILDKLLKATEANDYDSFVTDGNPTFKAGLTKQMLEGVSVQLSSRMKQGYQCAYLGELSQQGCRVLLWKLVFKDGGNDALAKLVLKDGKVAGFWLQ